MKTLLASIELMQTRLQDLAAIIKAEPEFANWYPAGNLIDVDFIQLFPDLAPGDRLASAEKLATVFGGEWSCDETDGSWSNRHKIDRDGVAGPFRVCLHGVELKKRPALRLVVLNPHDPSLDRVESPAITL